MRDHKMLDSVVIQSIQSKAYLKLSNPKSPGLSAPIASIQVDLEDRGMLASVQVLYEPYGLIAFFDDLVTHQTGWMGEKQWRSLESQCTICCTVDRSGHIVMQVILRSEPILREVSMKSVLEIDRTDLGAIATHLKQVLNQPFHKNDLGI